MSPVKKTHNSQHKATYSYVFVYISKAKVSCSINKNRYVKARIKRAAYKGKGKFLYNIAQYPVFRTAQSAIHFTSLADLFNQTPSRLLWDASTHATTNA